MREPDKLVSVIIPVYKVEKYLPMCVDSVLNQTYQNLEVILVDDGSPDDSGKICDRWAGQDSRIRVIHKANAGAGAARNTALDEAKGSLIGFVDSDDYLHPNFYNYLHSLMTEEVDISECVVGETDGNNLPMTDGTGASVLVCAAEEALAAGIARDAALTGLEEAMNALGELSGRTVREDITARIFERFCVGK